MKLTNSNESLNRCTYSLVYIYNLDIKYVITSSYIINIQFSEFNIMNVYTMI